MKGLPRALIITGIPGAGKTTTCRVLAAVEPRLSHIDADLVTDLYVSSRTGPGSAPLPSWPRQVRRIVNTCNVANEAALKGFVPLLDDVVLDGEGLRSLTRLLRPAPVTLVVLAPTPDVAVTRARLRPHKRHDREWGHLDQVQRKGLSGRGLWLDTSRWSAEATAAEILSRWREGIVVPGWKPAGDAT